MSKSKKEKNRLALVREIRENGLMHIPKEALKIKVKYVNEEFIEYQDYKKKYTTYNPRPLHEIRNNFNIAIKEILPIIEEYKYQFIENIAKITNHFEFNINVWISAQGNSITDIPLYSIYIYVSSLNDGRPNFFQNDRYGHISFIDNELSSTLKNSYCQNDNFIFELDFFKNSFDNIINNKCLLLAVQGDPASRNYKKSNINDFEIKLNDFIISLKEKYDYDIYNDDLTSLRIEYYIGDKKTYWAIVPERESDYANLNSKIMISDFRTIEENTDFDFVKSMLDSKILNINTDDTDSMTIENILDLSRIFNY